MDWLYGGEFRKHSCEVIYQKINILESWVSGKKIYGQGQCKTTFWKSHKLHAECVHHWRLLCEDGDSPMPWQTWRVKSSKQRIAHRLSSVCNIHKEIQTRVLYLFKNEFSIASLTWRYIGSSYVSCPWFLLNTFIPLNAKYIQIIILLLLYSQLSNVFAGTQRKLVAHLTMFIKTWSVLF